MLWKRLFSGVLLFLNLTSCSDDTNSAGSQQTTPSGGTSGVVGSGGSGVGLGGQAGALGVAGTTSSSGASSGGAGGGLNAITLGVFNVVTSRLEPGFETAGSALERVELPPRFTLQAMVPAEAKSVRFTVDGSERVDSLPPFRLTEDAAFEASPWAATFGMHEIVVVAFADTNAGGATLAMLSQKLELRGTGMDAAFTPTDEATNNQWVDAHLDEVMQAKAFAGTVGTLPYRLYTPAHYDAAVAYPLLVFLHGRGDRGSDNRASTYSSQLFHGPRSIVSPNAQFDFPSFVLVPQCSDMPANHEWARWDGNLSSDGSYQQSTDPWPSALLVQELIVSLQSTQHIESDRIYLTGQSMGGFGTWELTTLWPELFAAGAPMAGYSDPSKVSRILGIPFWVFHGDADQSNPVAGSRAMSKAITDAGGSARYTEYAGVDHGGTFTRAWTQEPDLQPWIYSQRAAK